MANKIVPLFAADSPQAREIIRQEIAQKISRCSSKCLSDVVTTSFEELTMRAEEYEKKEDSGVVTSMGDTLIEGINKITAGMLKAPNLVLLGNREVAVGHALEIMSVMPEQKAVAIFSMQKDTEYLGQLLLGFKTEISLFRLETGAIADTMWPTLTRAAGYLADSKLFLNDNNRTFK